MEIGVLIPAFNEAKTIGELVFKLKRLGIDRILVIDDGSSDDTAVKAESAMVIKHSENAGKGVCIKEGLEYFCSQPVEGIVLMDGDGQHNPDEIINFLECAKNRNKKMVVGNRMKDHKNMPILRWITNKIMSFVILFMCKEYVPDTQCGYRFLRRELIDEIDLVSCNYEIESEMVLKVAKAGNPIHSIPITTIYKEEISQIDPIRDGLRFLKLIIGFLFRNYKSKE